MADFSSKFKLFRLFSPAKEAAESVGTVPEDVARPELAFVLVGHVTALLNKVTRFSEIF